MADARAAATAAVDGGALAARKQQAVRQLTRIFGFDPPVAEQAVDFILATTSTTTGGDDAAPIDVTACYNYISDLGLGHDQGGPVTPIDNCPHASKHCSITAGQFPLQPAAATCTHVESSTKPPGGGPKSDTADDGVTCAAKENWSCLECGAIRCSRYCNGHAVQHWKESKHLTEDDGHCIAVSLSDLSVWCHVCQAYLSTSTGPTGRILQPLIQQLEALKFSTEANTIILQEPEKKKQKSDNMDAENEESGE